MSEDNSLPDEIISEILSPALKVPDKKFANTSDISPFTEYSQSPSAYLLVCKSWLRVATPLLYNVVVLRSKAQAKALGQALSKNKDLGQFIKHLRVEGGYGAPMRTILKAAPNITDLCLSFEILASDNTTGLCDGLASIRPRRLIVLDNPRRPLHNKMIERLADAVAAAIPQWQQLTILHCPSVKYIVDRPGIVEALVDARRLRELTVKLIDDVIEAYSVLQDCPLRSIQVTDPVYPGQLEYLNWEDQSTSLKEITKYETYRGTAADSASSHVIPAPPFPFTPMASEPQEVQDNIWSRVLYFLLSIPLWTGLQGPDSRLPFLLVSKTFYRLGLPHYYTHVVLIFSESVSKFANVLESNPSLGQHVRTIVVGNDFSKPHHDADSDLDDESDPMLPIMSKMTGLTKLWGCVNGWYNWGGDIQGLPLRTWEFHVSWDAFLAAVNSSGRTLNELNELSIPTEDHGRSEFRGDFSPRNDEKFAR
ncbi:hypothetical protein FB45DRAFT_317352 [Roridomyces roridus]|uniref:Uncharacterized protein n=1 Tax=Roridomyces roridus TaxID=1738132 RepID=A0AAD7B692_9AGAR|nr:hypothetical protein FB45DRAFT_317352 [Roridomyces roridus]